MLQERPDRVAQHGGGRLAAAEDGQDGVGDDGVFIQVVLWMEGDGAEGGFIRLVGEAAQVRADLRAEGLDGGVAAGADRVVTLEIGEGGGDVVIPGAELVEIGQRQAEYLRDANDGERVAEFAHQLAFAARRELV